MVEEPLLCWEVLLSVSFSGGVANIYCWSDDWFDDNSGGCAANNVLLTWCVSDFNFLYSLWLSLELSLIYTWWEGRSWILSSSGLISFIFGLYYLIVLFITTLFMLSAITFEFLTSSSDSTMSYIPLLLDLDLISYFICSLLCLCRCSLLFFF